MIKRDEKEESKEVKKFVVAGHNCESGDVLTVEKDNADILREIEVPANTEIGDYMIIRGAGAYCSAMSLKNYNSYPEAAEVIYCEEKNEFKLIRKR